MTLIKVLIVDDHEIMRRGLSLVFEIEDGFELAGEACGADEAVEKAIATEPDIVLMDIRMPGKNGIQATREIKQCLPGVKVMALTAAEDEEEIMSALESGMDGYILKNVGSEELAAAVRMVAEGKSYLHPLVARKIMDKISRKRLGREPGEPVLTARESMVLRLMAEGHKNKEIAAKLFLSEETVKSHVSNILAKLHQTDRMQAVLYALRHHLVSLDINEDDRI